MNHDSEEPEPDPRTTILARPGVRVYVNGRGHIGIQQLDMYGDDDGFVIIHLEDVPQLTRILLAVAAEAPKPEDNGP